jgi:hypothetical protein
METQMFQNRVAYKMNKKTSRGKVNTAKSMIAVLNLRLFPVLAEVAKAASLEILVMSAGISPFSGQIR